MKTKLLPKMPLDKKMLHLLNDFYKAVLPEEYADNPDYVCFSQPLLTTHFCNPEALLPDGNICEFCRHVPGRRCQICCHVNHFCLIIFAYRLGLGGEDFDKAYKKLSTMRWRDLKKQVDGALSKEVPKVAEPCTEIPIFDDLPRKPEIKEFSSVDIPNPIVDLPQDLITVQEAAVEYESTSSNIYNFIKTGKLKATASPGGRCYVSLADVEKLKRRRAARG